MNRTEIDRLRTLNAEMLAALKWANSALTPFSKEPAEKSGINMIRQAIARAEPHTHVAGTTTGKHIDTCALCGQAIARAEPHTHIAVTTTGKHIDTCALCGHDIRHSIHARIGGR